MTGSSRVPAVPLTGVQGALIKRMSKRMLGKVPAALGVLWNNPKVMTSTMGIGGKVRKWDTCDESLKSFAHMAVASMVGCTWCLDYNYFEASNKDLDLTKAQQVPRWRESDVFTPLERDVMAYAEAMTAMPVTVSDAQVSGLREQIGDAALIELTSVIAFANLTTRTNVALGIESDGFAAACGLAPLAERSEAAGASSAR